MQRQKRFDSMDLPRLMPSLCCPGVLEQDYGDGMSPHCKAWAVTQSSVHQTSAFLFCRKYGCLKMCVLNRNKPSYFQNYLWKRKSEEVYLEKVI